MFLCIWLVREDCLYVFLIKDYVTSSRFCFQTLWLSNFVCQYGCPFYLSACPTAVCIAKWYPKFTSSPFMVITTIGLLSHKLHFALRTFFSENESNQWKRLKNSPVHLAPCGRRHCPFSCPSSTALVVKPNWNSDGGSKYTPNKTIILEALSSLLLTLWTVGRERKSEL